MTAICKQHMPQLNLLQGTMAQFLSAQRLQVGLRTDLIIYNWQAGTVVWLGRRNIHLPAPEQL